MSIAATILLWLVFSVAAFYIAPQVVDNTVASAAIWGFVGLVLFGLGRISKSGSYSPRPEPRAESDAPPARIVTPEALTGYSILADYWATNTHHCGDIRAVRTVSEELNYLPAGAGQEEIVAAVRRGIERAAGQAAIDYDWKAFEDKT